jgi:hypothetical protein
MFNLEIPAQPVAVELVDPDYQNRSELTIASPSLPVVMLGRLANRQQFSSKFKPGPKSREFYLLGENSPLFDNSEMERIYFEPGSGDSRARYQLPDELRQFSEAITLIASHEHNAYTDAKYDKIAITARQSQVSPGSMQVMEEYYDEDGRVAVNDDEEEIAHRDGTPGDWSHLYMVSDTLPTEFYPDEATTDEDYLILYGSADKVIPEPYQIASANRTTFHRSPNADDLILSRTFLRMTFIHDLS